MSKPTPLHIRGAHIYNASARSRYDERDFFITDVVVEERQPNAITVDLSGYTIFPGLINAHDHLELNHYPRTKYRERYDNASEWSRDMNAHLNFSPFKELQQYPLEDRCFIGGLKNLLCGATTVAHHNPPHKCLFRSDFPVRVLQKYGWAHSLYLSNDEEIVASYKNTPSHTPWFIHIAEGTNADARGEYKRLQALGCVQPNTVFVHGVGLREEDAQAAKNIGVQLVLCPTTNLFLLGTTISQMSTYLIIGNLLGSDSRLTADGDLLDELRALKTLFPDKVGSLSFILPNFQKPRTSLGWWETINLRETGTFADFIAIKHDYETDHADSLVFNAHRADLSLVVRGGEPQIGDPDVMAKFPHLETVRARLDDTEKRLNVKLARRIARCTLHEPGLELLEVPSEFSLSRLWNGVRKP